MWLKILFDNQVKFHLFLHLCLGPTRLPWILSEILQSWVFVKQVATQYIWEIEDLFAHMCANYMCISG